MKYILLLAGAFFANTTTAMMNEAEARSLRSERDRKVAAMALCLLQVAEQTPKKLSSHESPPRKRVKKPLVECTEYYDETSSWLFDIHAATHQDIVEGCEWCDLPDYTPVPMEVVLYRKGTNEALVSE